ncbi:hypothetical protein GMB86_10290 [Terrilactibacillus sp. BCM23-1]|uniref:Spore coat protein n=1 Tax=Terrilactibacillus tamarindi TaxID=2599694 RepID=A0A6N8CQH1_9BACI|nr:hypothetical protein [Terrilactibacillus tamarindi]MTT32394.1 hypothetical protein [Terrilactibacillus tamarindi]
MESNKFGVHEITDMRELVNFKGACLSQAKSRLEKVENPELKLLVQDSIQKGKQSLNQMKELLITASTQLKQ